MCTIHTQLTVVIIIDVSTHSLWLLCAFWIPYWKRKDSDCCTDHSVAALGAKSRYFPPSPSVISNLRSCTDNPQTDNQVYTQCMWAPCLLRLFPCDSFIQFYHLCPSYFPHSYRVCLLTYTGKVPGLNPGRVTACSEWVYGAKRVIWCTANGSGQASILRCEVCCSHVSIKSAVLWVVTPQALIFGGVCWFYLFGNLIPT